MVLQVHWFLDEKLLIHTFFIFQHFVQKCNSRLPCLDTLSKVRIPTPYMDIRDLVDPQNHETCVRQVHVPLFRRPVGRPRADTPARSIPGRAPAPSGSPPSPPVDTPLPCPRAHFISLNFQIWQIVSILSSLVQVGQQGR